MVTDVVIAQRVAKRFIEASSPIVIKEVGDRVEVSGPYDSMKNLIPYLRGKFDYRGQDRTWWTPKAKMTPMKMKNLQKRVNEINGAADQEPKKVEESEEVKALKLAEGKRLISRAVHMRVPGLIFSPIPGDGAQLTGALTDLRVAINKSGGDYGPEFSKFLPHLIRAKEFEELLEAVENQGKLVAKAQSDLSNLIPRTFTNLRISVGTNNGSYLLVVSGKTYDYREEIKARIPATFVNNVWAAPIHQVKEEQVKKLLEYLEGAEEERAAKWKSDHEPKVERKRPNRRGDHCLTCGAWVEPGEGYLVDHWDNDEDEMVYKVKHSDPKICEEVRERARIRQEEARTVGEARRNLRELSTQSKYFVPGTGHKPPGKTIWIDSKTAIYGGGSWVVIEPDEQHFWYVDNNGADGDDWSHNNVQTGGAGALGWRLPYTDEARVLIEVAKE
jgi:hypothetical protein